ncbi:MAG TPA: NUMOD4 domain-containing protein [Thermoleophilia bacterium]|nr:NUMOD4 domain-containing protein [Thermoleophilia bacterium]
MDWRPLPGFPGYEVSDLGVVLNVQTGRARKPQRSDSGYLRVRINSGGKCRSVLVHLAVLRAFVGAAPSPRHDGAHLDGVQTNNALDNLAWKLPEDNEADKRRTGTAPRGFSGHNRPDHVVPVRDLLRAGWSYTRISRHVGIHRSSVSRIARGLRRAQPRERAA